MGWPAWQSGVEFSVMSTFIFCLAILSRFDFNMAVTNTTMTTAEKIIKDSPYKQPPKPPDFLYIFYYFYTYFSKSLTKQAKLHEVA